MKKFGLSLLVLSSVTALGYLFWLNNYSPSVVTPKSSTTKSKTTSPSESIENLKDTRSLTYQHRLGDYFRYQLAYQTDINMGVGEQKDSIVFRIEGKLEKTICHKSNSFVVAAYKLDEPKVSANGVALQGEDALIYANALSQTIYATLSNHGKIGKIYFPSSLRSDLRNNMKSILSASQLVLPALQEEKENIWETTEEDLNGSYLARHTLTESSSGPYEIRKERLRYVKSNAESTFSFQQSDIHFSFQGETESLKLEEKIDTRVTGFVFLSQVSLDMKLKERGNRTVSFDFNSLKEGGWSESSMVADGEEEFEQQRYEKILGSDNLASLWPRLEKLPSESFGREHNELFRKFLALMQLHPENIEEIAGKILELEEGGLNMSLLLSAMSQVKDPLAQKGIVSVIEQSQAKPETLLLALPALGDVINPSNESLQVLKGALRSSSATVQNSAVLAMGSMADQMQQGKNPQADAIVYDLSNNLKQSNSDSEKVLFLQALANTGHPDSLKASKEYLESENDELRAYAHAVIGNIPGKKAAELLSSSLETEKSELVKARLLEAIYHRPDERETFQAVHKMMGKKNSEDLRIKSAIVLWKMKGSFQEARALVEKMAAEDPSAKVKEAIKGIMLTSD